MAEYKFKVGDRVVATDKCHWGRTKKGDLGTVVSDEDSDLGLGVEFDEPCNGHNCYGKGKQGHCWWVHKYEIELIQSIPEPTPEPTPTIVNTPVDLYKDACWYCKKGGIVDRIFAGQIGICPSCGRVCNDTRKMTISVKPANNTNKPLTKEELEALVDGTRVFVVFNKCESGKWLDEPDWDNPKTCWRTKDGNALRWDKGHVTISKCGTGVWKAYLEEPKRPDFTFGDDIELPF